MVGMLRLAHKIRRINNIETSVILIVLLRAKRREGWYRAKDLVKIQTAGFVVTWGSCREG